MTSSDPRDKRPIFHYENGVPVFDDQRINDIERKQEAAEQRDTTYKDNQLAVNRRMMVLTGVLAGCAILGGGITTWQAYIANETLTQIKNSKVDTQKIIHAAQNQAEAAGDIADAAESFSDSADSFATSADGIRNETANAVRQLNRAAKASEDGIKQAAQNAQNALNLSINIAHLEQRPWIGVIGHGIRRFDKTGIVAQVALKNTGKTPALSIIGGAELLVAPAQMWDCIGMQHPLKPLGAMAPDGIVTFTEEHHFDTTGQSDFNTFEKVTDKTLPEAKRSWVYLCGQISYWDTRGIDGPDGKAIQPHTTVFCLELDIISREFWNCERGNDLN